MSNRTPESTDGSDDVRANLLAELEANVSLWQHDDSLRQQRNGTFLTVSAVLLGSLGAAAGLHAPPVYLAGLAVVFSVFGVLICRLWNLVQARNAEYVRFRRFQLRSIESRLPPMSTFTNTHRAFYEHESVSFPGIDEAFVIDPRARQRSTLVEASLPRILGSFWLLIGVAGVAVLVSLVGVASNKALEPTAAERGTGSEAVVGGGSAPIR